MNPSVQFLQSVSANLAYWRTRLTGAREGDFAAVDADWPNLRRAVEFGGARPELWPDAAALAQQAFTFVERRAYGREWCVTLARLAAAELPDRAAARCVLLDQMGHLYRQDWQLPEALAAHHAAEALAQATGDQKELAYARFSLSEDYRCQRDYEAAEDCAQSALALFTQVGAGPAQLATVYHTLGLIAHARGAHAAAQAHFEQALARNSGQDHPTDRARMLNNLGNSLAASGRAEAALDRYAEARALLEPTASEIDKCQLELSAGTVYFNLGRFAEAAAAVERADSEYLRQSGPAYWQALVSNNKGNVLLALDQLPEAERCLREALALWRRLSDDVQRANTAGTLAEVLVKLGHPAEARPLYDEALAALERYRDDAWGRSLHAKFTAQRQALESGPAGDAPAV